MKLVDSHCHLDDKRFAEDLEAVVERARAAGVERMLCVGTGDGPPDLEAGLRIAARFDCCDASVGVHPHDASKWDAATARRMEALLGERRVFGVGEIGLDYHYDFSPREAQRAVFREQLEMARAAAKPVIIHTREAWEDTMTILREHWPPGAPAAVMHCFGGDAAQALEALEMGFYISFAGVVTFPKASNLHEAARVVPPARLLVETDAPYLAPVPHRGKRNEPAYTAATARGLAELRGEDAEELAARTTANYFALRAAAGL